MKSLTISKVKHFSSKACNCNIFSFLVVSFAKHLFTSFISVNILHVIYKIENHILIKVSKNH